MRLIAVCLLFLAASPALAFSLEPLHPSADRIAAGLAEMTVFKGKGMVEREVRACPDTAISLWAAMTGGCS